MKTIKERAQHVMRKGGIEDYENFVQELAYAPEPEPVALTWYDGEPPFPQNQEWFIAVTIYGVRVVLKALPDDHTYDYTTGDGTYMLAKNIDSWMQFPDCEYLPPKQSSTPAPSVPLVLPEMSKNHIECIALDAGIEYCGDGVWRASPASMRDFAQRCINYAIPVAPTPAEAPADVARDAERYRHICRQDFSDRQWVETYEEFKLQRDTIIDNAIERQAKKMKGGA